MGFLDERRVRPVVDASGLGHDDLAVVRLAGNPIGILRREPAMRGLEDVDQRIPIAARHLELVQGQEILEVVPQPEADAHRSRELVAFEDEARQQITRTMLDGERIRQPQVVGRRDIRIVSYHGFPLRRPGDRPLIDPGAGRPRSVSMFEVCVVRQDQFSLAAAVLHPKAHQAGGRSGICREFASSGERIQRDLTRTTCADTQSR